MLYNESDLGEATVMKKLILYFVIAVILLVVGLWFTIQSLQIDVVEEDLPQSIYAENNDIQALIQTRLASIFVFSASNEYSLVEEIINYVILDSIRENINSSYDPLGDCETTECNYVLKDEDYYIDYIWANMNDDDVLEVHVGVGSNSITEFHTIVHLFIDVDIKVIRTAIVFTVEDVYINNLHLSPFFIRKMLNAMDTDAIESQITTGTIDFDELSYEIDFELIP